MAQEAPGAAPQEDPTDPGRAGHDTEDLTQVLVKPTLLQCKYENSCQDSRRSITTFIDCSCSSSSNALPGVDISATCLKIDN